MTTQEKPTIPDAGFIRQIQLLKLIPFSASTLWRRIKAGDFPAPVKLGPNVTAWRIEDVRGWMNKVTEGGAA